ncbi:YihY family inner membrane protein [Thiorhodococcus mannitoliphagus]|uniref:YihY family inner membrane protein n=1 Tax=Thiorhodococcus mannitoliphagus TaxID=329406 RepID=A0A6P1E1L1_9GAMM|nr:YhjD/YihY/BrkB family envelope integrity protein [Thiorhodococcus mannitoliphagus]NEX21615.1 YihY family inner membrane protein [Thiorhodococcus mannitoliphagus]
MDRNPTLSTRLNHLLWGPNLAQRPPWQAKLVWTGRLLYAVTRDLTQGNLTLHAMSLVYTTLLSLVPLLAVSFSVLKGFGVHNQVEPLLMSALQPLGASAPEITDLIIRFVDNMRVGVLGSVGLALLLYTVLSLIQKIEGAFNYAWRVTEIRPIGQRFTQYLSVLLIGPVLFFSAVGLSASLGSNTFVQSVMHLAPMSKLIEISSVLAPYLMISLTFAFVYLFVPNTRVRVPSALIGAFIAGLLWEVVGGVFSTFMAGSTRYMAIYSSLAILVLFMIWVYLGWLILLIGTSVAFYHQHPEYLTTANREIRLSNRLREHLALAIAAEITQRHLSGAPPCDCELLSKRMQLPNLNIQRVLKMLERAGYIVKIDRQDSDTAGFVLGRAPEGIRVIELLRHVRGYEETWSGFQEASPEPGVARVESALEAALDDALNGLTLRDLATGLEDQTEPQA